MSIPQQTAQVLADARIEIARIAQSQNEQILDQMVTYAAGYIRCACDQQLILADHWTQLLAEIEAARQAWLQCKTDVLASHQASAQIEVEAALKR